MFNQSINQWRQVNTFKHVQELQTKHKNEEERWR